MNTRIEVTDMSGNMSEELTRAQLDRQDVVDSAIYRLVNELVPVHGTPLTWGINWISELREAIADVIKEVTGVPDGERPAFDMAFYPSIGEPEREPPINTELFTRVRDHILREELAYNQASFGGRAPRSACGFAACIGGTAAYLAGRVTLDQLMDHEGNPLAINISREAQHALGLSKDEADIVFTPHPAADWPPPFAGEWEAVTAQYRACYASANPDAQQQLLAAAQARIAARYIDWIIENDRVH